LALGVGADAGYFFGGLGLGTLSALDGGSLGLLRSRGLLLGPAKPGKPGLLGLPGPMVPGCSGLAAE
jgi:hypothetical protein